jgi:hypothetical protein
MKTYRIGASNLWGTYTVGKYQAESAAEAILQAQRDYANSSLGRELKDVGAFRFYVLKDEKEEE